MQFSHILVRPRLLNLTEQPFESLVVGWPNLKRCAPRSQPETGSGAEAAQGAGPDGRCGRRTGIGRSRGVTTLPPRHRKPNHDDDQADLQEQADDRRQSAKPAEQSAAKQHAQQAGTQEARGEAAEHAHAGPIKEASLGRPCGSRCSHSGGARLSHGTVKRLRRIRRGRCARRSGERSSPSGTRAAATADAGIGRGDREHQR